MSVTKKSFRGPRTIFRWEVQIPFGLLCVSAYFYFAASEGRKEPVLAGIGYGALTVGIFEFFLRRRVQKLPIQRTTDNSGAAPRRV
jgi:hypothetical protein